MSASHWKLDNLILLVDVNGQQADGPSTATLNFEPLGAKFSAFGWHVQRVDGNDIPSVRTAFDLARAETAPQPRVIICDTRMAKGVPFLEERERNHFLRVEPDEWSRALAAIEEMSA
jgi:transketolase